MAPDGFYRPESWRFWVLLALFKIFMAFNSRTVHQPDENQQGVEVSYQFIYGDAFLTWEWNPVNALRSTLQPFIYAAIFEVLKLFHLNYDILILYGPNLFHVFLSLVSDWCFIKTFYTFENESYTCVGKKKFKTNETQENSKIKLSDDNDENKIVMVAFFVYTISWYSNMIMVKTFSNTIEATFFTIILFKWMKIKNDGKTIDVDAIILTAIMTSLFFIRNSSVIPWLIPMMYKVFVHKTFTKFLFCGLFVAIPVFLCSVALDSYYYGRWVFTAYNFLNYNVIEGKSSEHGVSSPFTYISVYSLIFLTALYPFLIAGIIQNLLWHWKNKTFPLLHALFWPYILVLSSIGHKEPRFMFPLFPICCIFVSISLVSIFKYVKRNHSKDLMRITLLFIKCIFSLCILISMIMWLHTMIYSSPTFMANDYIKSQNPKGSIMVQHHLYSRIFEDFNYEELTKSKIKIASNIGPLQEIWKDLKDPCNTIISTFRIKISIFCLNRNLQSFNIALKPNSKLNLNMQDDTQVF